MYFFVLWRYGIKYKSMGCVTVRSWYSTSAGQNSLSASIANAIDKEHAALRGRTGWSRNATNTHTHQSIPTGTHQSRMKIACFCQKSKRSLVITPTELLFVTKIIYNKSIIFIGTNNLCRKWFCLIVIVITVQLWQHDIELANDDVISCRVPWK